MARAIQTGAHMSSVTSVMIRCSVWLTPLPFRTTAWKSLWDSTRAPLAICDVSVRASSSLRSSAVLRADRSAMGWGTAAASMNRPPSECRVSWRFTWKGTPLTSLIGRRPVWINRAVRLLSAKRIDARYAGEEPATSDARRDAVAAAALTVIRRALIEGVRVTRRALEREASFQLAIPRGDAMRELDAVAQRLGVSPLA